MLDRSGFNSLAIALAMACSLGASACAESGPARASAGASQASAASVIGLSGAASYTIGAVIPGPIGGALQDGGLTVMEDARRLGQEAAEMMSGPLPVTEQTIIVGPPPAEALRTPPAGGAR